MTLEDEILNEAVERARRLGLSNRDQHDLAGDTIRQIIRNQLLEGRTSRTAAGRESPEAKAQRESMEADKRLREFIDLGGPEDPEGPEGGPGTRGFPITYGRNPKTGTGAWNNLGWIGNDFEHLPTPQRQLAPRYNEDAMRAIRASGAYEVGGEQTAGRGRDPFRPPPEIMAQARAEEAKKAVNLRKFLTVSARMAEMKINPEVQQEILAQMFPGLNRRKLQDEIAKANAVAALQEPGRQEDRDIRRANQNNLAEHRAEIRRMTAERDIDNRYRILREAREQMEASRGMRGITPEERERDQLNLYRMTMDLVARAGQNEEAGGAPGEDSSAGFAGLGSTEEPPSDYMPQAPSGGGGFREPPPLADTGGPRLEQRGGRMIQPGFESGGTKAPPTRQPSRQPSRQSQEPSQPQSWNLGKGVTGRRKD